MLKTLDLINFRGFESLHLRGLKRINIFTGPNGAGKTAILEGIVLGCRATPDTISTISAGRNMVWVNPITGRSAGPIPALIATQMTEEVYRAQWDHLFYKFDTSKIISIRFDDTEKHLCELKMYFAMPSDQEKIRLGDKTGIKNFVMERKSKKQKIQQKITMRVNTANQIQHEPVTPHFGPVTGFFGSHAVYAESDNLTWFSQLTKDGREEEIIEIIRREFPQIKKIFILAHVQSEAIWADLGDKRLPLSLVSAGITKILTLILAAVNYKKGVIIVDEVENGIFHEKYADLWSILYRLCKENDNQLFISTHSLECLRALAPTIKKHENDFCLLRASITKEDALSVRQISGKSLSAAVSGRTEVR